MSRPKVGLHRSHDEIAQALLSIVGQIVYGHHGPTRIQVLSALKTLDNGLAHYSTKDMARMGIDKYIKDLTEKAAEPFKQVAK